MDVLDDLELLLDRQGGRSVCHLFGEGASCTLPHASGCCVVSGGQSVGMPDWRQADRIEAYFCGFKGDQEQRGNARVCTQGDVHGPRSVHRAATAVQWLCAVALMELSSCHPTLPDGVPLSSYRSGEKIHVWKYDQVLRAFREVVEKSGRDSESSRCIHCGLEGRLL